MEHGGMVMVNSQPEQDGAAPTREPADRAARGDDERFVFWDTEGAGSLVARRSEPAAVWLHAQPTSTLSVGT